MNRSDDMAPSPVIRIDSAPAGITKCSDTRSFMFVKMQFNLLSKMSANPSQIGMSY